MDSHSIRLRFGAPPKRRLHPQHGRDAGGCPAKKQIGFSQGVNVWLQTSTLTCSCSCSSSKLAFRIFSPENRLQNFGVGEGHAKCQVPPTKIRKAVFWGGISALPLFVSLHIPLFPCALSLTTCLFTRPGAPSPAS